MSLPIILFLIFKISFSCLSSDEIDGLCTACLPTQSLSYGFCLNPIKGCVVWASSNTCAQCESGLKKAMGFCEIQQKASRLILDKAYIQVLSDNVPDLRYEQINYYFKKKYQNQLLNKYSNPLKMAQMESPYASIYQLIYVQARNPNLQLYRAEAAIDYQNKITQLSFSKINPLSTNDISLLQLTNKIRAQNWTLLKESNLNKIARLSQREFRYYFIDQRGKIHVIDAEKVIISTNVNNLNYPSIKQLFYELNEDTVLNYIFSNYPFLQASLTYVSNFYTLNSSKGNQDYYKYIFDSQNIVVIQIKQIQLCIDKYIQTPNLFINSSTYQQDITAKKLLDGYQILQNKKQKSFITVYQLLIQKYPIFIYKIIVSVKYQIISGVNYLIFFSSFPFQDDQYVVSASLRINGVVQIGNIYFNGIILYNPILNIQPYQKDFNFKEAYRYFVGLALNNNFFPPPIKQMSITKFATYVSYKVIYSQYEYLILRYSYEQKIGLVQTYQCFGNKITFNHPNSHYSYSIDINYILYHLKKKNNAIFSRSTITKLSINAYNMQIQLLTVSGLYAGVITLQGIVHFTHFYKLSTSKCADMASTEWMNNSIIINLDKQIKKDNSFINNYVLSLVQIYYDSNLKAGIRILYSQLKSRIQARATQEDGFFDVKSLNYVEGGDCQLQSVIINGKCSRLCTDFCN